jgi:hypothetical protein
MSHGIPCRFNPIFAGIDFLDALHALAKAA